jgi:hypothetical protein
MVEADEMDPRGNGLTAASYVPLAEIDPRLTASVLDVLREAGVAAYAVAATSRSSLGWEVDLTNRPVDRLYVDARASQAARDLLDSAFTTLDASTSLSGPARDRGGIPSDADPATAASAGAEESPNENETEHLTTPSTPGRGDSSSPTDLDATWQQIIAGFDTPTGDAVPRWPADEDVPDQPSAREGRVIKRVEAAEPAELADSERTRGGDVDEEHFVPPPPPPLPAVEPVTKLAWAGVLGGPAVLLAAAFGLGLPSWAPLLAVAAFIGGFATLVMRLKDRSDSDPDDGAVV